METPSLSQLKVLCEELGDKVFTLSTMLDETELQEWQARGCHAALHDLNKKVDTIINVVCREPQIGLGSELGVTSTCNRAVAGSSPA